MKIKSNILTARLLAVLAIAPFLLSCSKQKADITLHYSFTNGSVFDLKLKTSDADSYDLPAGGTVTFTEITEGVDYHGSCSFKTAFQEGSVLTVLYKEKEYDYNIIAQGMYFSGAFIGIMDASLYDVRKIGPREYTLGFSFRNGEIVSVLRALGVWEEDDQYYDQYYD